MTAQVMSDWMRSRHHHRANKIQCAGMPTIALAGVPVAREVESGHEKIQHSISQELQPLVSLQEGMPRVTFQRLNQAEDHNEIKLHRRCWQRPHWTA